MKNSIKFKVGDKVKRNKEYWPNIYKDDMENVYTVLEVRPSRKEAGLMAIRIAENTGFYRPRAFVLVSALSLENK